MNEREEYDIVIVGAGPAGYPAAIRASRRGASVAVVEEKWLGGTCLNAGCIPTKYFCKRVATGDDRPWSALIQEKNKIVNELAGGIDFIFKKRNIRVFKGHARIVNPREVIVTGQTNISVRARLGILYAPGSVNVNVPSMPVDHEFVWDSDDVLNAEGDFASVIIVGAGAIGLEWATILRGRGMEVTVVEMMPQILPGTDEEVARRLASYMRRVGVKFHLGTKVEGIDTHAGHVSVKLENGETLSADRALVAVGRRANVDTRELAAVGIEMEKGRVKVTTRMATTAPGVWAAGDAADGGPMLAHVATRQGQVAVENMLGNAAEMDYDLVPWAVFTDPEAAGVGLDAAQARARGIEIKEGKVDYRSLGRPRADGKADGFLKILAAEDGLVIGAQALGAFASEIVQIVAAVMAARGSIRNLAEFIAIHPTYGELVLEAAEDWFGFATHKP